jgi:predicted RecB family nuclease
MPIVKKNKRVCKNGHPYYKSSSCPVCPVCERNNKPKNSFLSLLSAPARRALENKDIQTINQLSKFNESEILELHGMGPGSLPKLRGALKAAGLSFKK